MNKKGFSLWQVPTVVITLVVIAVILSIGSTVVQDVRDDNTANSFAYNASDQGLKGLDKVAGWQDNIGTVIGAAVILTIILGTLAYVGMKR